jgi:nickel-dependent lactate racemase
MRIDFPYDGIPSLEIGEGNLLGVYGPNSYETDLDEGATIATGLSDPIGSPPLKEVARKAKRVLLLVDDSTRTTPAYKILPLLLSEFREIGIGNRDISILIAQGTHRKMDLEEKKKKLGQEVLDQITVFDHAWNDVESLQYIGTTLSGIPVWINKLAREHDFIMGIGHIVPHSEAGFSGGAKIVQHGICGRITTEGTHWISPSYETSELMGKVDGPVRREIEAVSQVVGLNYIVNVVQDRTGRIVGLFSGDPIAAFRRGCALSLKIYAVGIPRTADIVVIDSYPCDTDFWVAAKAFFAASLAVRAGGVIILVTPCPEGISSEHPEILNYRFMPFTDVQRLVDRGSLRNDRIGAAFLATVGNIIHRKAKCIIVSNGIDPGISHRMGLLAVTTPQEGLYRAFEMLGTDASVTVLRQGGEIMPVITG